MGDETADRDPRRGPWAFEMDIATRWLDNDQYGHLNNSAYYLIHDSIVNTYLISQCGLQPYASTSAVPPSTTATSSASSPRSDAADVIGLVISSSANYYAPTSFPSTLRVKLRAVHLGRSSVRYEVGVFERPLRSVSFSTTSSSSLPSSEGKEKVLTVEADGEAVRDETKAAVVTQGTHVFVDRITRRPVKAMPAGLRKGLERLLVVPEQSRSGASKL